MKAFALLAFLLGVAALIQPGADFSLKKAADRAVAMNFSLYRNEVRRYVALHPDISGEIPLADLDMPQSWNRLRNWRARVENGYCYVYGEATPEEIAVVREFFHGSMALGMAWEGRLVPVMGNPISIPPFVPNGSLVSITEEN